MVTLLLWTCQKLTLQQNFFRRNWMPEQLSGLLVHATSIPPWLLRPLNVSTSSELYPDYFWLPIFLDQGIQFFNSPPFPTQSVRLPLVAYPFTAQHVCDLQDTMPYAISHQVLPTQPLLGKQRISLKVTSILSICLCSHIQLDCNQLLIIQDGYLSMSKLKMFYL